MSGTLVKGREGVQVFGWCRMRVKATSQDCWVLL